MNRKKILIVDDEEGMRHMLSIILKKEGYSPEAVPDGKAGLARLKKDDGIGFDVASARECGGNGLASMEERAAAMAGSLIIDSVPGSGARIMAIWNKT